MALWDVFGEQGAPVRATISDMGPLLLARILELNDTQEGVLALVFKVADDEGQLLLDLKDLRAMLQSVADRSAELKTRYGNVSAASVGAIQRSLLTLESQGAEKFFGEPMLDVADLMRTDAQGRGIVNVLAADKLMQAPRLYAIFLLWLLGDLYEAAGSGRHGTAKLVFFFDEAHLLFTDAPQALLTKIEQVVRLVRSKGVGVYFVTQNPLDIPDTVLGQLGNRVQHALRLHAARPEGRQDRGADHAPESRAGYRGRHHRTGRRRGLVSLLDAKGRPQPTERAWIVPPASRIGPATDAERQALRRANPLSAKYEQAIDRESAYEVLAGRASAPLARMAAARPRPRAGGRAGAGWRGGRLHAGPERSAVRIDGPQGRQARRGGQTMAKSTVRTVARNWREASWDRCLARRGAADVAGGLAEPSYLTMRCHTQ